MELLLVWGVLEKALAFAILSSIDLDPDEF
jgi:hypothetical protein